MSNFVFINHSIDEDIRNIKKRIAFACRRKRRKFSKDARKQAVLTHSVDCYSYIFILGFPTTFF